MARGVLLADARQAAENLSIFDPASPSATAIRDLAVVVLFITGAIFLIVELVLLYSIVRFRRRPTTSPNEPPQVYGSYPIEVAWTAAPALVVFVLVLIVARTEWEVRPRPPEPREGDNTLFVTAVGKQWWWEYRYEWWNGRKSNVVAANELHIPISGPPGSDQHRPLFLELRSADVVHSWWVPRLSGKTDLIPGRVNMLSFAPLEPGLFLGQCAEFCGTQHANMLLRVSVDSPDEFEAWLANQEKDAVEPANETLRQGQKAFLRETCVNCHRIAGTPARGTYAPDLTHVGSRQTLASGMIPNTKENLIRWIRNPQIVKPGCLMPAFQLSDADLGLIADYLTSLK